MVVLFIEMGTIKGGWVYLVGKNENFILAILGSKGLEPSKWKWCYGSNQGPDSNPGSNSLPSPNSSILFYKPLVY